MNTLIAIVDMAGPKPMLTEFGFHHRLESFASQRHWKNKTISSAFNFVQHQSPLCCLSGGKNALGAHFPPLSQLLSKKYYKSTQHNTSNGKYLFSHNIQPSGGKKGLKIVWLRQFISQRTQDRRNHKVWKFLVSQSYSTLNRLNFVKLHQKFVCSPCLVIYCMVWFCVTLRLRRQQSLEGIGFHGGWMKVRNVRVCIISN